MLGGRKFLFGLLGLLAVALLVGGYLYADRVPRPSLDYPSGQSLTSVRGNCRQGNEVFGCKPEGGPRSFLTIKASGDKRATVTAMFNSLLSHGWKTKPAGATAHDFLEGGAPEDLQPLYCRSGQGCVGLFRFVDEGYVLAWFA